MKTILATLCLLAAAFGQTAQITDKSPSDSPMTLKGSITFGAPDTDASCTITGHNNGSRMIVAYVVSLDVMRTDGHHFVRSFTHDHFFKNAAMLATMAPQPGADFDANLECWGFGRSDGDYVVPPQPPSMTVTATFVQFDDGSVWGDGNEVMFQRQEAIKYLQALKASTNLTQALVKEPPIEEPSDHRIRAERGLMWAYLSEKNTPQAQADELDRRLAIIQAHSTWLK